MQQNSSLQNQRPLAVVIMAAGKGTRMKDPSKAKVMYEVLGKPMLHYVIELAHELTASRIIAIVGYQRDTVIHYVQKNHSNVEIAIQTEQLGTGHAIMQVESLLKGFQGDVLILSGDVPLLTVGSLKELVSCHRQKMANATILTSDFNDPTGYGRIIRSLDGSVERIVEQKDATQEERQVKEINSGIYMFDVSKLFEALKHITKQNVQNEYYLTDVFGHFWKQHWKVYAVKTSHTEEILGVNTIEQLEDVQAVLLNRKREKL